MPNSQLSFYLLPQILVIASTTLPLPSLPLHLPLCPPFLSLRPLSRTIPLRSLAPSLPCSLRIYSMFLSFLFILPCSTLKIMDFYMTHNLLYAYCIYNITTNLYFIFSITTSLLKYSLNVKMYTTWMASIYTHLIHFV